MYITDEIKLQMIRYIAYSMVRRVDCVNKGMILIFNKFYRTLCINILRKEKK